MPDWGKTELKPVAPTLTKSVFAEALFKTNLFWPNFQAKYSPFKTFYLTESLILPLVYYFSVPFMCYVCNIFLLCVFMVIIGHRYVARYIRLDKK